jgi:hypothetical protein
LLKFSLAYIQLVIQSKKLISYSRRLSGPLVVEAVEELKANQNAGRAVEGRKEILLTEDLSVKPTKQLEGEGQDQGRERKVVAESRY